MWPVDGSGEAGVQCAPHQGVVQSIAGRGLGLNLAVSPVPHAPQDYPDPQRGKVLPWAWPTPRHTPTAAGPALHEPGGTHRGGVGRPGHRTQDVAAAQPEARGSSATAAHLTAAARALRAWGEAPGIQSTRGSWDLGVEDARSWGLDAHACPQHGLLTKSRLSRHHLLWPLPAPGAAVTGQLFFNMFLAPEWPHGPPGPLQ